MGSYVLVTPSLVLSEQLADRIGCVSIYLIITEVSGCSDNIYFRLGRPNVLTTTEI